MYRLTTGMCVLLCATAALPAEPQDPFKRGREQFQREYAHVDRVNTLAPSTDSESLKLYPLYPYLQAARLRRALAGPTDSLAAVDERAATFVDYYEREPVGRAFRRAWLSSLAERGLWEKFLDVYRDDIKDEVLRCQSFDARIGLSRTEGLAEDITAVWLTPRSVPSCESAFEWLKNQNRLTPELIEQRARLALKDGNAGFAKQLAGRLPPNRAAPVQLWAELLDNPARAIDQLIASPDTPAEPDALLAGWTRLARGNREAALARFEDLVRARELGDAEARTYAATLAMPLAWDRNPDALQYFERAGGPALDERAQEWQIRAALWAGDWKLVTDSIAALPDALRTTARWRYWAARAAEAQHDSALAQQLYESVLPDDNFYSVMSAARLDRAVTPHLQKLPSDKTRLREIGQLPAMVRARELIRCDMRDEAASEWQVGFQTLPEDARREAIHLAASWGWYEQAIATASQQRVFNDYELLYPRPFEKQVLASAHLTGLPPELIYSVLRQESLYRSDAISGAGAIGLLQLMPDTARRTARTWQRPRPRTQDLLDPDTNIALGAAQLRTLIDRFGGQTSVALAGYNAGPNAASRWLPEQAVELDVWVENIPYNETRTYVQRVVWHSVVFGWLRSGEPQKSATWLARVAPLDDPTVVGAR